MTLRAAAALSVLLLATVARAAQIGDALGPDRARLLLTRAGFAPGQEEIDRSASLSHGQAVDRLLATARTSAATPAPAWIDDRLVTPRELRAMTDDERKLVRRTQIRNGIELRGWWLREMTDTPSPLTERMTLFWHNHFVSAQPKVRYALLMYRQNLLLRQHALGNFRELLHAVAKDPAMLIYLDSATNRRGAPNENFAREVMELFTLGEGAYSEADVKEAARAFTGWSIDPATAAFMFRPRLHDDGEKTVLGTSGKLRGEDVLDILLAQPATAEFIVRKLWREFVSPQPDSARVTDIAKRFRKSDFEIAVAVRELLLQPEVVQRSEDNALVKSPVELVVGLLRQSQGAVTNPAALALGVAGMGQNLFAPPNVRGWPGGEAWINTQTLLARKQFLERSVSATMKTAVAPDPGALADVLDEVQTSAAGGGSVLRRLQQQAAPVQLDAGQWLTSLGGLHVERSVGEAGVRATARQLLVLPPSNPLSSQMLGLDALRAALLDPVYQLK